MRKEQKRIFQGKIKNKGMRKKQKEYLKNLPPFSHDYNTHTATFSLNFGKIGNVINVNICLCELFKTNVKQIKS